jgi:hypothetical protein
MIAGASADEAQVTLAHPYDTFVRLQSTFGRHNPS